MRLEQNLYESPCMVQRERVYTIVDLESLSATALYTGKLPPMGPGGFGVLPRFSPKPFPKIDFEPIKVETPKVGMMLLGGLKIKDINPNTITFQQDFGGVGNIYTNHLDGHGALRFYGNEFVNGKKRGNDREDKKSW